MVFHEVKKAIIAAAGLGSRMYPYTKIESKLMMQIVNKPIVEYLIEELSASGIEEVVIVSNHITKIQKFFNRDDELNKLLKKLHKRSAIQKFRHIENRVKVDIIGQYEPRGWMHEILHAKEYLKDEPFLVCFSDVLYQSKMPAAKQSIKRFEKEDKNIYATGRYVFKPSIFNILEKKIYIMGEVVAEDVFDELRQKGDLFSLDIKGSFFDVGDPLSYMKTETMFALSDKKIGEDYRKFLNTI